MSNWVQITLSGLKMMSGFVLVADSMSAGGSLSCLVNGSLALAPLAWGIASHLVSDNCEVM